MFKVIHKKDFAKYGVREVHEKIVLMIAWCLVQGQDAYASNIMITSTSEHDIIRFVRKCKEMNEDFQNKEKERNSYYYGTPAPRNPRTRE